MDWKADNYQISQLPEGLTVATAAMPHMASVSLGLWVGVGGRFEPLELHGASHFIEHLLFKGTKRRSAKEISQSVEGIGGYLNAFTSEENTCFYSKARHDRFDELLDVLADMLLNSKFAPVEINKERSVIKEEIAMYLDQPQQHVQEILNDLLWPDHPMGRSLAGTNESLDGMDRAALTGFLKENYTAQNTLIVAAGNLDHAHIRASAQAIARRFPAGKRPVYLPVENGQDKPAIRLFTKKVEQTQIALALRTCSRHDDRRFALRLMNTILGENMSSRLFQVVREDAGLAYSIYSSLNYMDDTGILSISAGLDTGNLVKTLKLVGRELRRMTEAAPTAAELRRARDYVIGQMDLGLENTESQMNWLGEQLIGYGRIMLPGEIKQRLMQVTAAQVRAMARDFLRPEKLSLALVSPLKSDAGLLKHLAF